MRKKEIRAVFHKAAAVLLVVFLIFGMLENFNVKTASAATPPPGSGATAGNSLPTDETQVNQAKALGFSTEQMARLSPSGKEIDKKGSPLGPNNLSLNRISQVALAMSGMISVYDNPLGTGRMFNGNSSTGASALSLGSPLTSVVYTFSGNVAKWAAAEKSITAADVDGNGKQEVVTAGLWKIGADGKNVSLHLMISDYSSISNLRAKDKDHTVVASLPSPSSVPVNTDQYLLTAAGDFDHDGKDEIAIAVGGKLYVCRADLSSCTVLSSTEFDTRLPFARTIADLQAADANGDGFPDLLVTLRAGVAFFSAAGAPYLYIYHGTDVTRPKAQIKLQFGDNEYFRSASVTVGDAFGNGNKTILLGGGTPGGKVALSYVLFHPETETYDTAPAAGYFLDEADFNAVKACDVLSTMGLKCVSLKSPVPGDPQYVVLGGFIFRYDSETDAFVRQDVTSSTNNSNLSPNNVTKSHGSITNVNVDKDETYILSTLVGNFDGNTLGEEQIILLHYNKWYNSEYVYATTCSMNSSGAINAALSQIWEKPNNNAYSYPAIGAPDVYNRGTRLEFLPSKSTFMFSNPTVLAVLGASPYYQELTDKYGALGGACTTYGTSQETGTSSSNAVKGSVGVSFGYEWEIFGPAFKIEFETEVTNSFTYTWSNSTSVSKDLSFTSYCDQDGVQLLIVPYDVYFYKVYTYDGATKRVKESEMSMLVPYAPLTTIMPLTEYNQAAAQIPSAPVIGPEVLKHTIGDPRSYPQTARGLSNVSGKEVLTGGTSSDESTNFVAAGVGNSNTQQAITTTASKEGSFDYELEVEVTFEVTGGGAKAGLKFGAGYAHNATTSSSASTLRSGSVASVPVGYEGYNFSWCLVAYNYNLQAGDSTQECVVINYLTRPIGQFPPAIPANFKLKSQTLSGNTLQWDPAASAAGYWIARSTSPTGAFTNISGSLEGKDTTSYTDANASAGQTYYYTLVAYAAKESLPTAPLQVQTLAVNGVTIKTQPKLLYTEGDALDLSRLAITLKLSNDTSEDIAYANFGEKNLGVSLGHGVALTAAQSGVPVTVTYTPNKLLANTNNLTVNAKSPYDLTCNVDFAIFLGRSTAAPLGANIPQLHAMTALTNNQSSAQQALVIMALYNGQGAMVKSTNQTSNIAAKATVNLRLWLDINNLPASSQGYTAKVFVWDGADLKSSTLIPKTPVFQFNI